MKSRFFLFIVCSVCSLNYYKGEIDMKKYVIYLRKSRKDIELELIGEGETLARHKAALIALAKKKETTP